MELLEKTFRWFGSDFGVTLQDVKQTGATGVVTALHNVPAESTINLSFNPLKSK